GRERHVDSQRSHTYKPTHMGYLSGGVMRFATWRCLTVLFGVLCAAPAFAQGQATSLAGVVIDAQGGVLPGVTVTATSPALIGSRTVVTEPNGSYRFPSVREGSYTLSFELT